MTTAPVQPGFAGAAASPFTPTHPARPTGPVPVWRGFVGERARTAVYGWSRLAFQLPYMKRKVLGFTVHIPMDPDLVQRVLLDNAANYVKPDVVKRLLAPAIGEGLLTSDGELWREQRRIVAANFAPAAVDGLVPAFGQVGREALEEWRPGARDMAREATRATMRVISNTLFGGDARLTSDAAMAHIAAALEGVSEARLQAMLGLPRIPWTRRGWIAQRGQAYLRRTLETVVSERLPGGGDDFLGRLIRGLGDRFEPRKAAALAADNAMTFYLAGHETTANAVTWALYLLSRQPDLQARVSSEAAAALASGEDSGLADRLPLLRRVLDETLRLYPPAPRFDRQAVAADRLGGEAVEPGDIVSIWPWLIHRHESLWDDPDVFDPDRFLPERREGRHRFQFIPFGGGQRLCVGMRFATVEALAILAHWVAAWRFEPVSGREVRVSGMVTLRPAGGLPLSLTAIANNSQQQ